MKKIIIISLFFCFSLLLVGCASEFDDNNVRLVLDSDGGSNNRWSFVIENLDTVAYNKTENNNVGNYPGSKLIEYYYFQGLKEGESLVIFTYGDVLGNNKVREITYKVYVDKNLKTYAEIVSDKDLVKVD